MIKLYFSLFVLLFSSFAASAQLNYTFSAVSGTYTPLSNPDTANVVGDGSGFPAHNNGIANGIPIGFTFAYNGAKYNTINAHTDGFASFSVLAPILNYRRFDYQTPDLTEGPYSDLANSRPVLAPLWDDNDLYSQKDIVYKTTGTAPNRVFTLQWNRVYWDVAATGFTMTFQILLFEKTNVVEFHYQQLNSAVSPSESASIGITGIDTGRGNFISIGDATAHPDASSTIDIDTINKKPPTGQIYRFTPMNALPVKMVNFSGERKNNGVALKWVVENEQNTAGFEIQRSVNGRDFEKIAFVDSKAVDGMTGSSIQYAFVDPSPANGSNHYRIKQIDKDGEVNYSVAVLIKFAVINQFVLGNPYPNPARANVTMLVSAPAETQLNLVITDLSGKVFLQKIQSVQTGDNTISLNTGNLSTGNYLIKAVSKSGIELGVKSFIKH